MNEGPFMRTTVVTAADGKGGARITGSLFGLPDVLGLLHADQLAYAPGAGVTAVKNPAPAESVNAPLATQF